MFVCCCLGVNDKAIARAIEDGACSVERVSECTRAGTKCGSCKPMIAAMVEAASRGESPTATPNGTRRRLDLVRPAA
jgi:bacterioferritin-associated ferredoxin